MDRITKQDNSIRRLLILTAVLVSAVVTVFAVLTITVTNRMTRDVERMYQTEYGSMLSARALQSGMLRIRSQVESYLQNPGSGESRATMVEIHRGFRANMGLMEKLEPLISQEEYDALLADLRETYFKQNEALAAGQNGQQTEGLRIYADELLPMYTAFDARLETALTEGTEGMRESVARVQQYNDAVNTQCIVLAVAIVGFCVVMFLICIRRVQSTGSAIYRKEVVFGLIAQHADVVFEVYSLDEKRITYVSDNIERVFGVSAEQYMSDNKRLRSNLHPDDYGQIVPKYCSEKLKEATQFEFRYTHPTTEQQLVYHSAMYPIVDDEGTLRAHVMLTQDVTADRGAQQRLQSALDEAEYASKARREFLARMSHEIRTPINGIMGMQKLAAASLDDKEKAGHYLEHINSSAEHLLSLVNDVLDMSRIESGRLEMSYAPFDLEDLVRSVQQIMSERVREKGQSLEIDTQTCTARNLVGDELRLRQVLLNFLSNANKYIPEGGHIRLVVRQTAPKFGFTRMTFSVEDDGPGIPMEEVHKLFQPFERGNAAADKTSGTGLGLPISKHIIEEMGGNIWAESTEREGSVFSFDVALGVSQEQQDSTQPTLQESHALDVQSPEPANENEEEISRVLLVDDNPINMEIAAALLEQQGFTIEEAWNGQEAVEKFEESPVDWYQAILMDLQMPVMDGLTATQRIRDSVSRDGTQIQIYAVSANELSEKDGEDASIFNGFFPKPIDVDRITEALNRAVSERKDAARKNEERGGRQDV